MGNPATFHAQVIDGGPCRECAHYGGRLVAARPAIRCLHERGSGYFFNDAEKGCKYFAPGSRAASGMTMIVCGGRNFADVARAYAALDAAHARKPISTVMQGGASGADSIARQWATNHGIPCDEYSADWDGLGRKAGPVRNQAMADTGAGGCIAFPGGAGTADMVRRAEAAGIPVWRPYGP